MLNIVLWADLVKRGGPSKKEDAVGYRPASSPPRATYHSECAPLS